jgi:hypothetical protein
MYISISGFTPKDKLFHKSATYNKNFCNTLRGLSLTGVKLSIRDLNTVEDFNNLQDLLSVLKPCLELNN